jgi:hypothetical protein
LSFLLFHASPPSLSLVKLKGSEGEHTTKRDN